jgi:hypothetical protein
MPVSARAAKTPIPLTEPACNDASPISRDCLGGRRTMAAVPESQRIRLDPEAMKVAARLGARPMDDVLLAAGDEPLIIRRAGPAKVLETSLDFGSQESAHRPEIPLLVNLMFEQLLGGGDHGLRPLGVGGGE